MNPLQVQRVNKPVISTPYLFNLSKDLPKQTPLFYFQMIFRMRQNLRKSGEPEILKKADIFTVDDLDNEIFLEIRILKTQKFRLNSKTETERTE